MMLMTAQIWMDRGSIVLLLVLSCGVQAVWTCRSILIHVAFKFCCLYKSLLVEACNQLNDQLTIALNPLFQNLLITSTCF